MITCYIVDDESHAIEVLASYIQKTPGLLLIGSQDNPLDALNQITSQEVVPDVTFVDVDMPQLSGVELSGLINKHTVIVFTTAFSDYAIQAFEKDAIDYLLKPITYERFLRSVNKIKERLSKQSASRGERDPEDYFYVKSETKGKMVRIEFDDIIYIQGLQNYITIHTPGEEHITYLTMKEINENLPASKFSRVHKSYIVNNQQVKVVEGNHIILKNKSSIPLGVSFRTTFLEGISEKLVMSKRRPGNISTNNNK